MELRLLHYFVTLAEELHFSRAAQRLSISQPPLSVAIKQLEQELQAQLFERSSKGVRLTAAGEHLLGKARQAAGDLAGARQAWEQGLATAATHGDKQAEKEMTVFLRKLDRART